MYLILFNIKDRLVSTCMVESLVKEMEMTYEPWCEVGTLDLSWAPGAAAGDSTGRREGSEQDHFVLKSVHRNNYVLFKLVPWTHY